MSEFANALKIVLKPFNDTVDFFVVNPILMVLTFWIDFYSRYLLDSHFGHIFVRLVLAPLLSYILSRVYDFRGFFSLFNNAPDSFRTVVAGISTLFDRRILNVPTKQLISNIGTVYADVMYGKESRSDTFEFFYFCTFQTGRFEGLELGTGGQFNGNNAYFPQALNEGVKELRNILTPEQSKALNDALEKITHSEVKEELERYSLDARELKIDPSVFIKLLDIFNKYKAEHISSMTINKSSGEGDLPSKEYKIGYKGENGFTVEGMPPTQPGETSEGTSVTDQEFPNLYEQANEKHNIRIAMSCLLFSLLTYQTDEQLKQAQEQGMIKDIEILSVSTKESGTAMIAFVNHEHKFAVFGYRGTQFEVMRQMLTSLDFRTDYFLSLDSEKELKRTCLGKERARIRTVYYNEVKKSSEQMKFKEAFCGERLTPRQLLEHLKFKLDYKIYLTGHSLGGGLSTVFAAHLLKDVREKCLFDALVTFGATPVGDKNFVKWFNENVPVSWRFVFGDEFAPMVPPLPWFQPAAETKLVHVGDFHHFDIPKRKVPKNAKDADKLIQDLAYDTGMMDMFVHHNPLTTLRALRYFYNTNSQNPLKRLRLNVKNKKVES